MCGWLCGLWRKSRSGFGFFRDIEEIGVGKFVGIFWGCR